MSPKGRFSSGQYQKPIITTQVQRKRLHEDGSRVRSNEHIPTPIRRLSENVTTNLFQSADEQSQNGTGTARHGTTTTTTQRALFPNSALSRRRLSAGDFMEKGLGSRRRYRFSADDNKKYTKLGGTLDSRHIYFENPSYTPSESTGSFRRCTSQQGSLKSIKEEVHDEAFVSNEKPRKRSVY